MLVATGVKRLHGKEIYEVKASKNVCLSLSAGSSVASIPLRAGTDQIDATGLSSHLVFNVGWMSHNLDDLAIRTFQYW